VTSTDNIANAKRVQTEATVALEIKSLRVTSLDNIANGETVQREATVAPKKSQLEWCPLITLQMG
jgi:hypothetical protein